MTEHKQTGHLDREERRANKKDLSDWHVLIVDDQMDNIQVVQVALSFHGAEVRTAKNGVEGLKILETFTPTLILLDLSMPEMNGWEMLEQLRARPEYKTVPVIALTAHAMGGDKERVLKAGFTGYIPKPFSVVSIFSEIEKILNDAQSS